MPSVIRTLLISSLIRLNKICDKAFPCSTFLNIWRHSDHSAIGYHAIFAFSNEVQRNVVSDLCSMVTVVLLGWQQWISTYNKQTSRLMTHQFLCRMTSKAFLAYLPCFEKKKKRKYAYIISMLSVCLCLSPINFDCLQPILMKLGIYVMAPELISKAYFINSSHQSVCVCVSPCRC
jgi:hypothetical protein